MSTVTALKQSSPEHVSVLLADGAEISSTLSVAAALRLFAGRELDARELEELRALSRAALAREKALLLLSHRPHACKELRDKLVQKGEEEAVADECVNWLCEQGFLDDARYAGMLVRHYAAKNYGAARIREELRRRGVARELWDEALGELPAADEKLTRFIAARLKHPEDKKEIQRVSNALFRRGYGWDEIKTALRQFTDSISED